MITTEISTGFKKATLEEYFEQEFIAENKNEFIKGQIIPMPYTSDNHGLISLNISGEIRQLSKGKNIRTYAGDRLIYSPFCNENYYPDIVVVNGQPEFYDYKGKMQATLNPVALFEVLSDSTEVVDRNEKWPCYREIKSLRQFFLVSQKEPYIEFYTRQDDSSRWLYEYVNGLDKIINVVGFEIPLREIYALVDWNKK